MFKRIPSAVKRCVWLPLAAMAAWFLYGAPAGRQTPRLLALLPADAVTPDGMAMAPDGELVVACPNFASYAEGATRPSMPACLLRIDRHGHARKWVEVPVLAETGRSCPMGIEFGPDGDLYVVDNQNWPTGNGEKSERNQGRILRLKIVGDRVVQTTVLVDGLSHPNGVRYRDGQIYVTVSMLPRVKRPDGLLTSAVYQFPVLARDIHVASDLKDPNLLATFVTENRFVQYGADGLVFDRAGNLYVGNFGDGQIHRITFGRDGSVAGNAVFARTDMDNSIDSALPGFLTKAMAARMRTVDGLCMDRNGNLYAADFSNNAIDKISRAGVITVLAQNGDTDGQAGQLNEPGEPIVWNGRLVVSNFDTVTGPDKVNTHHDSPATLSVLRLD